MPVSRKRNWVGKDRIVKRARSQERKLLKKQAEAEQAAAHCPCDNGQPEKCVDVGLELVGE